MLLFNDCGVIELDLHAASQLYSIEHFDHVDLRLLCVIVDTNIMNKS